MQFERDGAELAPCAVAETIAQLQVLLSGDGTRPGQRLVGRPDIEAWLDQVGIGAEAARRLGDGARPVRAILFDRSDRANWSLGWHQDRTIAVSHRCEIEGFDRWTTKDGINHVEPPFELIERMATVRIHLDAVPGTNAPLLVIPGSHRLGRLEEEDIEALVATEPFACLAGVGDAWWYRTAIVHGSARSHGGGHRRVLQIDYSPDALPLPLSWRGIA